MSFRTSEALVWAGEGPRGYGVRAEQEGGIRAGQRALPEPLGPGRRQDYGISSGGSAGQELANVAPGGGPARLRPLLSGGHWALKPRREYGLV